MDARAAAVAVEKRIFEFAKVAIQRVTGYIPVPISGKDFQISKGDVLSVNPVTAKTKTTEVKNLQHWHGGEVPIETWSDRGRSRGWIYYCRAEWMAFYFEDAEVLFILDWPKASAWFVREYEAGRLGKELEPRANSDQKNKTLFIPVEIGKLRTEGLVLFEQWGTVVRTPPAAPAPQLSMCF